VAWYPKAIRKEIKRHRTLRVRKGRVCLHVAVSESSSLFGYFNRSGSPTSHFYVRRDGTIEQYVDTKYRAPANLEGNSSLISFETQGGMRNADSEPWTAAQVQAMAECIAWLHKVEGVPLQLMPNSKSTSLGVGWHKQGVDPYRVSGGEKWSSAYGKICPGGGKIRQIPTIVAKAKVIAGGSVPPGGSKPTVPPTPEEEISVAAREDILAYLKACTIQIQKHNDQVLLGQVAQLRAALEAEINDVQNDVQRYAAFGAKHTDQVEATTAGDVKAVLADEFKSVADALGALAAAQVETNRLLAELVAGSAPKA
jgi:hypothetical protein